MANISMKALLESGVHFGHRTHRWNPKMKQYIFTERNGIHIIDLQQTVKTLNEASKLVRDTVAKGGSILFVGTKRQAQEMIEIEAKRCNMPFVTVRWLGGMLTNWTTMRQRINELERMERMRDRGDFDLITKKEALGITRQIEKLEMRFSGIRKMPKLPDLVFIVDVRKEETAVREANILGIPVVAMVDTNCDPETIDYVIPANDDAIRAIKLIVGYMADAVLEGKAMRKDVEEEIPAAKEIMKASEKAAELDDDALLGAATLARLAEQKEAASKEEVKTEEKEVASKEEAKTEEKAKTKAKKETKKETKEEDKE